MKLMNKPILRTVHFKKTYNFLGMGHCAHPQAVVGWNPRLRCCVTSPSSFRLFHRYGMRGLGKGLLSNIWNSFFCRTTYAFCRTTYAFWGTAHPPLLLAIAIVCRRIVEGVGVIVLASMGCDGKDGSWNLKLCSS